ncbi:MAG: hypothetical protein ACRYG5_04400 [Janthinobacterium lividum]
MPFKPSTSAYYEGSGRPGFLIYLDILMQCRPFATLSTKIARARGQDQPVLYPHALPGLDLLLCAVPGAHPPYAALDELVHRCVEHIDDALEQPLEGLCNGGFWYESNGFGVLIFATAARQRVLDDLGLSQLNGLPRG